MNDEKVDIVIVEDDPNDAELITRVFRKHNMANKIVLLKDGAEALDFFFGEAQGQRSSQGHPAGSETPQGQRHRSPAAAQVG